MQAALDNIVKKISKLVKLNFAVLKFLTIYARIINLTIIAKKKPYRSKKTSHVFGIVNPNIHQSIRTRNVFSYALQTLPIVVENFLADF